MSSWGPRLPTSDEVLGVLAAIQDPDLGRDVVSLGMIKDLDIGGDGRVSFTFELTTPACPVRDRFQAMAKKLVGDLPGVTAVDLKMTANVRSAFNGSRISAGYAYNPALGTTRGLPEQALSPRRRRLRLASIRARTRYAPDEPRGH